MKREPTFIVLIGQYKGGTTLLMRLLNCFPQVRISGESAGAISDLLLFYHKMQLIQAAQHDQALYDRKQVKPVYYHKKYLATVRNGVGRLLHEIYFHPFCTHYGFKEIKFGLQGIGEMTQTLLALRMVLPAVKFIFLTRKRDFKNVYDLAYLVHDRSGQVAHPSPAEYATQIKCFTTFARAQENCFLLDYADLGSSNRKKMRALFQFLELSCTEAVQEKYAAELKIRL